MTCPSRWLHHSIFQQHIFSFRNLHTQHLLAQHFQIWLEGLKKRGVYRLSLHSSNLLIDEKNPNANVELLPFAHFIVSHEHQKRQHGFSERNWLNGILLKTILKHLLDNVWISVMKHSGAMSYQGVYPNWLILTCKMPIGMKYTSSLNRNFSEPNLPKVM